MGFRAFDYWLGKPKHLKTLIETDYGPVLYTGDSWSGDLDASADHVIVNGEDVLPHLKSHGYAIVEGKSRG